MEEETKKDEKEEEIESMEHKINGIMSHDRKKLIPYDFGICNKCTHFLFVEFEGYGNYTAYCQVNYANMYPRSARKRVIKCNNFWDSSHKTIREMSEIATWISTKKGKMGFSQ